MSDEAKRAKEWAETGVQIIDRAPQNGGTNPGPVRDERLAELRDLRRFVESITPLDLEPIKVRVAHVREILEHGSVGLYADITDSPLPGGEAGDEKEAVDRFVDNIEGVPSVFDDIAALVAEVERLRESKAYTEATLARMMNLREAETSKSAILEVECARLRRDLEEMRQVAKDLRDARLAGE